MATSKISRSMRVVQGVGLFDVAEFENYTDSIIDNASFTPDGGTAQANLSFSGQATLIIFGANRNIHVMCFRANGELHTRNKVSGTWESEWTKRW